jgi:phage terminase large subunit
MSPSEFAKEKLKLTMWPKFSAVFDAVEKGHRRILVRSANGVGKTTALAALCNWKLWTSNECIVLTTSSSEKQVKHNLWGEIRRQAFKAGLYEEKDITDTRIKLDEKRFMLAVNPAKPESAQGYHAASIFIAVDEATGVRRDIISSLIATATGDDVQIVMIYNPMSADSFVYEAERSGEWKLITISALEHPNVTEENNTIKGAVTVRSTEERFALWSEEVEPNSEDGIEFRGKWWRRSLEVSRRILGMWHEDSGEGLIPRRLLTDSLVVNAAPGIRSMGVDIASGGEDETVIARFDGGIQLPFITLRTNNAEIIMKRIEEEYKNGFTSVAIDETGAIGKYTPVLLERGIEAHSVHFAAAPTKEHKAKHRRLANKRIEMYYHITEELRRGELRLLNDDKLHEELASVRLSDSSERDTYYLEKKKFVKARLGRSPDRADATCLARYAPLLDHYKVPIIIIHAGPGRDEEPGRWRHYQKPEDDTWGLPKFS